MFFLELRRKCFFFFFFLPGFVYHINNFSTKQVQLVIETELVWREKLSFCPVIAVIFLNSPWILQDWRQLSRWVNIWNSCRNSHSSRRHTKMRPITFLTHQIRRLQFLANKNDFRNCNIVRWSTEKVTSEVGWLVCFTSYHPLRSFNDESG